MPCVVLRAHRIAWASGEKNALWYFFQLITFSVQTSAEFTFAFLFEVDKWNIIQVSGSMESINLFPSELPADLWFYFTYIFLKFLSFCWLEIFSFIKCMYLLEAMLEISFNCISFIFYWEIRKVYAVMKSILSLNKQWKIFSLWSDDIDVGCYILVFSVKLELCFIVGKYLTCTCLLLIYFICINHKNTSITSFYLK